MKQIESTRERLVFEDRPTAHWVAAALATLVFAVLTVVTFRQGHDAGVIFLVFAISGPVYVYFFVETRSIVLDRRAGTATLRRQGLRGTDETTVALTEVARADVHRATSDPAARVVPVDEAPSTGTPVRPVLTHADGNATPLVEGYSKDGAAFDMAREINAWFDA